MSAWKWDPMNCPVVLLVTALSWSFHAGLRLLWRVGTAVIVAGTVFGIAIIVSEQADSLRNHLADTEGTILSVIVSEPVIAPHG